MRALALPLLLWTAAAWAQQAPNIGYACPAGGSRGQTVEVTVGGQNLRTVSQVLVFGQGVKAEVVKFYPPVGNLMADERAALVNAFRTVAQKRWEELLQSGRVEGPLPLKWPGRPRTTANNPADEVKLPQHPLLDNLDTQSLHQLSHARWMILNRKGRQPNAQIAEMVKIKLTMAHDAPLGPRELRLFGRGGLSNALRIEVDKLPEFFEYEPNDPGEQLPPPEAEPLVPPFVMNGQIMPGDADRFRCRLKKGQSVVFRVQARTLIPFLADAVPGWFQAVLTVFDESGTQIAFADDFGFEPDPLLRFVAARDGIYTLEIRDAIYRGREDFVYRLSAGDLPVIAGVFPLGAREGSRNVLELQGWGLRQTRLNLMPAFTPHPQPVETMLPQGDGACPLVYGLGRLPETMEDTRAAQQPVRPPLVLNGRILIPGETDTYTFTARQGETIVAEIEARKLRSPLDSLLRLLSADGQVIAWNDDAVDRSGHVYRGMGTLTHYADSYLRCVIPKDGRYTVTVSDACGQGSLAHAYRLRLSRPRPDFELLVTPSALNAPPGGSAVLTVHVLRQDGFDGEVHVTLKPPSNGFELAGGLIPAGQNQTRMTLAMPPRRLDNPLLIEIEGSASIEGRQERRQARAADEVMQAFLWRHLVPARQLLAAHTTGFGMWTKLVDAQNGPLVLPKGGETKVRVHAPSIHTQSELDLSLTQAPAGLSIRDVAVGNREICFTLKDDGQSLAPGYRDNLIVEVIKPVYRRNLKKQPDGKPVPVARIPVDVLPAIPILVTPSPGEGNRHDPARRP